MDLLNHTVTSPTDFVETYRRMTRSFGSLLVKESDIKREWPNATPQAVADAMAKVNVEVSYDEDSREYVFRWIRNANAIQ